MSDLVEELRDSIACYRVNYDVDGWQLIAAENPEFSVMHGAAMAIDRLCNDAEKLLAHIERLEAALQAVKDWDIKNFMSSGNFLVPEDIRKQIQATQTQDGGGV